jgi:hypothetical protein
MSDDAPNAFAENLGMYVSAYSIARMASGHPMTAVEILAGLLGLISSIIDQCPEEARPALLEASHSTLDSLAEQPVVKETMQ